jgi:hypothetical protein
VTAEPTAAARLRGTAAGLLTAALAVAAHGAADGTLPSGTAVALLAVLAATVGGLATTVSRAADVRVLIGLLATAQAVGHVMLTAAGHSHGTAAAPATAMLIAHALAVASGAVLIAAGDRLCRTVARAVQVSVRAVAPPVPAKPVVIADADHPLRSALLLAASMSHRGPPVSLTR